MLVIYDGFRNGLQALVYQLLNLLVAVVDLLLAVATHQVQLHAAQVPLPAEFVVVVL